MCRGEGKHGPYRRRGYHADETNPHSRDCKERHRAKINNVAYLLNEANLRECFELLKEGKAAGIDGDRN